MLTKNIAAECATLEDFWFPKVIGEVNGQLLKVAKLKGQLVWHAHDEEDELFYIVKGELKIELQDRTLHLAEGDFATIAKGTMHNPIAEEECWILLIEPASTKHTGNALTPRTRSLEQQLNAAR
ncbi:cupin domain-containing protein [Rhizobium sp. P38BS-XIX]|uniref:cupin domain-containing protein n=1 Tax=Rhizobium sp. P38BS-XIX TaxID=2726740 RepID=UPI0014575545|nr:cupin domain-containing protein [Rhizobium sp. P38BS-XIX]NLS00475.1 cupin domain-containing protein [Rhizobium sp. P38BS-XIX]